jgi:hypothetical protein
VRDADALEIRHGAILVRKRRASRSRGGTPGQREKSREPRSAARASGSPPAGLFRLDFLDAGRENDENFLCKEFLLYLMEKLLK